MFVLFVNWQITQTFRQRAIHHELNNRAQMQTKNVKIDGAEQIQV